MAKMTSKRKAAIKKWQAAGAKSRKRGVVPGARMGTPKKRPKTVAQKEVERNAAWHQTKKWKKSAAKERARIAQRKRRIKAKNLMG